MFSYVCSFVCYFCIIVYSCVLRCYLVFSSVFWYFLVFSAFVVFFFLPFFCLAFIPPTLRLKVTDQS